MAENPKWTPYPFTYPSRHTRKHGPTGYRDYDSFRDWLRDEFTFRCVFCLRREQWSLVSGTWDIEHFTPQSRDPSATLNYDNLLYACRTCNSIKSSHLVPDPTAVSFSECLTVAEDGSIEALNEDGKLLIEVLRLDNDDYTEFRSLIIETLRALKKDNWGTFARWMSYPSNLPDLSRLRPPGNSRPDGVHDCFFARRSRGELEDTYE